MSYILASASPRRKELFSLIVPDFEVIPSDSGEKFNMSLFPEQVACSVAEGKCDEVFARHPDSVVVACDTIVVFEGEILGKPKDRADAERTLRRLSGKTHSVISGVCVRKGQRKLIEYDRTEDLSKIMSAVIPTWWDCPFHLLKKCLKRYFDEESRNRFRFKRN